jgi:hypothetical protein
VLRDGGRFGVIWTGRDRQAGWVRDLDEAAGAAAAGAAGAGAAGAPPSTRRREITLPGTGLFGRVATASFPFTRTMTVGALVDMLATYSRVITASPQDRAAGLARARAALAQRFPGADEIEVPMRAFCWRADRTDRDGRA